MSFVIVGLGNPGEEYENNRHNAGRMAVLAFAKKNKFPDFEEDKMSKALVSKSKIGKSVVTLVLPENFMNNSGASVKFFIDSPKKLEKLIVVYDDFQLPIGRAKMSYNKSSGGHNGLQSVIKAVKSEEFARIRIGLSKSNAKGIVKIPKGEKEVESFILGDFKKPELETLKKVFKNISECLEIFIETDREEATMFINSTR
jgi:PTH1 family peptidyl-tRNA hydrolase